MVLLCTAFHIKCYGNFYVDLTEFVEFGWKVLHQCQSLYDNFGTSRGFVCFTALPATPRITRLSGYTVSGGFKKKEFLHFEYIVEKNIIALRCP